MVHTRKECCGHAGVPCAYQYYHWKRCGVDRRRASSACWLISSIAHSGYLLLGVLVLVDMPIHSQTLIKDALVTYLLAYTLMNTVAFGVVASLGGRFENEIRNYAGLSKKHPFMAAGLALALISFDGPTADDWFHRKNFTSFPKS